MTAEPKAQVVQASDLVILGLKVTRDGGAVRYMEGARYGLATSIFRSEIKPGSGPGTHSHPYAEVFVLHEGMGRYVVDDEVMEAQAGDVVIVPADAWHSFSNPGSTVLRQTAIHEAPTHSSTPHPDSRGHV